MQGDKSTPDYTFRTVTMSFTFTYSVVTIVAYATSNAVTEKASITTGVSIIGDKGALEFSGTQTYTSGTNAVATTQSTSYTVTIQQQASVRP